jgi:hypothetical protein
MSINVQFATVIDAISNLSVSGVTLKDVDTIPENVQLLCPVLFPRPDNFITEVTPEFVTYGSLGTAKINLSYTLNFMYCHAPIGSGLGGVFANYGSLITNLELILEKILESDVVTGAVDLQLAGVNIAPITDPAGNNYFGAEIALRVQEFAQ